VLGPWSVVKCRLDIPSWTADQENRPGNHRHPACKNLHGNPGVINTDYDRPFPPLPTPCIEMDATLRSQVRELATIFSTCESAPSATR
jgi:hypothetical protein